MVLDSTFPRPRVLFFRFLFVSLTTIKDNNENYREYYMARIWRDFYRY